MNEATQSFQIWLNAQEDQGFYLGKSGRLPAGAGQITFADMGMFICTHLLRTLALPIT
jgi:hypothetical protein